MRITEKLKDKSVKQFSHLFNDCQYDF